MLKPALLYKEELEKKFAEIMYDDDFFLYTGYPHSHELPDIGGEDNIYQYAIIAPAKWDEYVTPERYIPEKVIGWFTYRVDPITESVFNFGLYSFDRGNPEIGKDVFTKMEELISQYKRVEWRVISGNPVIRHYDKFCKKHGGQKIHYHDSCKDIYGNFRDEYVYEILSDAILAHTDRITGHWVEVTDEKTSTTRKYHYECSVCRGHAFAALSRYCPHCGARMIGKEVQK